MQLPGLLLFSVHLGSYHAPKRCIECLWEFMQVWTSQQVDP